MEDGEQTEDAVLLRRYAEEKSEEAFAELVRRHLNLVYSVALRQVAGDAHLAEDVTQQVFTALARKAAALAGRPALSGWLYRSAHFAASDVVRAERRRRAREQEVHAMNSLSTDPTSPANWEKFRPVLDSAIAELDERDRDAVALRFFDGRSFADVGARLRLTENAARMRVERALDKLHGVLARRGVTSTAAALGVALGHQVGVAAPAGLAASVTGAALTSVAAGGAGAWVTLLTMSKIKVGIAAAVAAAVMVTGVVELQANRELHAELQALAAGAGDVAALEKEGRQLSAALQKLGAGNPEAEELARLQRRAAVLKARPPGVVDAEMRAAATWRNAGRATPEAANETLHWAIFSRDLDALASLVVFDDNTPENREAFMAHFSEAVRARYRTPERAYAATLLDGLKHSPDDAAQLVAVDDHVGGNGSRFGQKRVRVWYRLASGDEFEGGGRWQTTPDGWAIAAFSLAGSWEYVQRSLDPATGDRRPPGPSEHLPLKK